MTQENNQTISLYDLYASAALTGLLANTTYFNCDEKHNMIAEDEIIKRAADIADRMVKMRLDRITALEEFSKIFSQQKFKKGIKRER